MATWVGRMPPYDIIPRQLFHFSKRKKTLKLNKNKQTYLNKLLNFAKNLTQFDIMSCS